MEETQMRKNSGFTLVEILIVVIILGILAAIVIPQFTQASSDAKMSSVVSDLQTVRSQIELYKIQHGDRTPDKDMGAGDVFTQLMKETDATGADSNTAHLGPYLQQRPKNPFVLSGGLPSSSVALDTPAATDGWYFDRTTNQFKANGDNAAGDHLNTY
jgi:general secretion pathway protein G